MRDRLVDGECDAVPGFRAVEVAALECDRGELVVAPPEGGLIAERFEDVAGPAIVLLGSRDLPALPVEEPELVVGVADAVLLSELPHGVERAQEVMLGVVEVPQARDTVPSAPSEAATPEAWARPSSISRPAV